MNFLTALFGTSEKADFKQLKHDGALIIDVRTPGEFAGGHITGSINIPLDKIPARAAELKKKNKPIVTCYRSGNRSGMAKTILAEAGCEVYNGGAWNVLNEKIN